jgi:uncharacterized protein (TIGR00299 family) protein
VRVAYFDAFSGVSGDMTVGAMLDLGLALPAVDAAVRALDIDDVVALSARRVERLGVAATKFEVRVHGRPAGRAWTGAHPHGHRPWRSLREQLETSRLAAPVRERALAIFAGLADAEAAAHGIPVDDIHFHEVGALDAIVDVVGAAVGAVELGIEAGYASPLALGSGWIEAAHGRLPVPGPAVAALVRDRLVRWGDGDGELVTPTGAAIVRSLTRPGPVPEMQVERVGYGAGDRELDDRPNLLRLVVGTVAEVPRAESVVVLEATIDDMNPELWEHVLDRLFASGARDAFLTPVVMKRGRPGTLLRVLCDGADRERLAAIVFAETSTIGLRWTTWDRLVLPREIRTVTTSYGAIEVKIARAPDGTVNVAPELASCRRVATERGVPLKLVYQAALAAALATAR